MVRIIKDYLTMDGLAMKTLFTVGSCFPPWAWRSSSSKWCPSPWIY